MTRRFLLSLTGLVALLLASCGTGPDRQAQAAILTAAQQGQPEGHALYRQHCAGCHGLEAGGGLGPRLLANPRVQNGDYVAQVVAVGRRAMPGFGDVLEEDELEATLRFVRSLGAEHD